MKVKICGGHENIYKITESQRLSIIDKYQKGAYISDLSRKFGLSVNHIKRLFKRRGIQIQHRPYRHFRHHFSQNQIIDIITQYNSGVGATIICVQHRVTSKVIYKILRENNIYIRKDWEWQLGKELTEGCKQKLSDINKGSGNPAFIDGKCKSRKVYKRRKNLGYCPLNEKFKGSVGHHINKVDVLYIPEDLHKSIPHRQDDYQSMADINTAALFWLADQELSPEDWRPGV